MTKPTPGVSVIIPAYNAAAFIAQALESLIAQSSPHWEAIVIDDGSTDQTVSVASSLAERDARIRVLSQAHQGVSAARNAGVRDAQFDWLLFLDADDWILPEFLEKLTTLLVDDPELDAVYCGYARAYTDGSQLSGGNVPAFREMFPLLAQYCVYPIHTCIVRRSRVEMLGGFDASLITCEDWDLWQRIARSGSKFSSLNEVLACYRIRPTSASMDSLQMLRDGLRVIQRGHSADPRVAEAHPSWAAGMPVEDLAKTQLNFTCWTAGLAIGSGQDAAFLLNELPDARSPPA
jgi:glycosyltransferase involved in cell wall biosynthesis